MAWQIGFVCRQEFDWNMFHGPKLGTMSLALYARWLFVGDSKAKDKFEPSKLAIPKFEGGHGSEEWGIEPIKFWPTSNPTQADTEQYLALERYYNFTQNSKPTSITIAARKASQTDTYQSRYEPKFVIGYMILYNAMSRQKWLPYPLCLMSFL